ncbi:phosphatidylglycerophosphatase A family protein [Nitrosococcus oceani]|uniref:Phosphatidylglycerophosphatase A n=2 Tax=Nitrosococcus oceani TaxID=1229 RepID=Q3JCX8_NITOC|nr:phosphatidylglycerophosphatase A [Nitrosococcus oceani]KFI20294.1 phosphatidylglycerophosphatase [Nitrosococcus oceani C-27]ABA57318.1 phosphatidylglycerophosphatase [Nitrosococcus oceani ATCC 19707]EDZ67579.1 phosphatidylglycerophosphatase A [Nitrosococcus oceani AFC27]KFI23396.1 phosphatidylglycerophosphatase [Nitrosococcus oceani]GEM20192.1 phosphatidylglycerophosphatase A [Nitrosococcus oceani]
MAQDIAKISWRQLLANPIYFLAFGFGSGLASRAPGTFGTLPALPFYWWIQDWPLFGYVLLVLVLFLIGIWVCHVTARDLEIKDPAGVVWDEFVGFLVTMTAAPSGWGWLLGGFILFRLFDIWKPWPIRVLDRRIAGGLGIMLDDVVAGIFAALVLAGFEVWMG